MPTPLGAILAASWRLTGIGGRLPVVVRAVLVGLALSLLGTGPLVVLLRLNLKILPSVPWSVPVMTAYLWLYWRYLGGWGWPRSTADARRRDLRAGWLEARVWRSALWAGGLAIAAMTALRQLALHFSQAPQYRFPDLAAASPVTIVSILAMVSVVAGVVEEAAYRGYMQAPIERRHGPAVGIGVTALAFTMAHFQTYPNLFRSLALFLALLLISLAYGLLAHLSGSILPGVVLHATGDAVGLLAGWQLRGRLRFPPLSETGLDGIFWFDALSAVVLLALTVWAYRRLARTARKVRGEPAAP